MKPIYCETRMNLLQRLGTWVPSIITFVLAIMMMLAPSAYAAAGEDELKFIERVVLFVKDQGYSLTMFFIGLLMSPILQWWLYRRGIFINPAYAALRSDVDILKHKLETCESDKTLLERSIISDVVQVKKG